MFSNTELFFLGIFIATLTCNTPVLAQICTTDAQCSVFDICFNLNGTANGGFCVPNPAIPTTTTTVAVTTTTASTTPSTTTVPSPPRCPYMWTWYPANNLCYFPIRGSYSYFEGAAACRIWNATVAAPDNALQNYFIWSTYTNGDAAAGPFWIGVRKLFGTWMVPTLNNVTAAENDYYPTGYHPIYFSQWRPSQPDGCCGADVTCVLMDYDNFLAQWDDAGCEQAWSTSNGVMCQRYAYQPL